MLKETVPRHHFESLYRERSDPWRLSSSAYEAEKYRATLAALPRPHYARALEIGCAIGVLTAQLAPRCDDLLAVEPVEAALAQARRRNADRPHVRFVSMFVPAAWPEGRFDLVLLSEVIDYLGEADIYALAARIAASLDPGGDLVMVHWIGKKAGPPSGREASDLFIAASGVVLDRLESHRNADYRMDILRRR